MKHYDATKEFAPLDRSKQERNHPNKHNEDKHPVSGKRGTKRLRG